MELKNKTAIITGASKGIGKAIAETLAKEGVNLGLISRTLTDLQKLQDSLGSTYGVKVVSAVADISDRSQAAAAVASLEHELGAVDILINNAGIATFGTVAEMDPEEWERIIRVNLMGTYYVTHAVLPSMLAQKSGNIINISSTAGERGFATGSAYCASKFALMGFTEALMQEVRKSNIRVTALTPSTVNTELAANAGLPIGDEDRMLQPQDLADLTLATLKLPPRVQLKVAGIWTTNPQ
ncbi:3-ketoacyl-ACP reductase [Paenibacillus sp. SEL3]|jgi:3-oxoacyl-[acyl-carrier protein] reductase|uniref:3-ketoacyl-ACP reductase n=1 Tax=Paenibacillus TaxID=44249 RepID=UPI0004D60CE4|nr:MULTISPECIES: 3-ketoacyl-ACP reductase [Paenibacillus]AMH38099.1 diacetyl reductase [Paenibacillus polymyxa]KEO78765.1 3-ketoacyl-ACP reductase [Paenibacillus polymyxa]MBO3285126.1 3-ketoacyl-ACP reductase [Paenibacillus polymyxa]MBP1307869.1 3-oxoacyl-[acyl-carrier protein] reductase [Paenibacillus sp. 1182]MCH6187954.1 3-ketoacyl-ACP reductase [Paenibacillus polymyxa]